MRGSARATLSRENLEALPRNVAKMLTGSAVYVDDIHFEGEAFGVVVRSPHPHAFIRNIDASAAREKPGVLAVLTGKDIASVATPLACIIPPQAYGRSRALKVDRPILAVDRVRHVGDGVAFRRWGNARAGDRGRGVGRGRLRANAPRRSSPRSLDQRFRSGRRRRTIWRLTGALATGNCAGSFSPGALMSSGSRFVDPPCIPNPIEPRGAVALYDHKTGDLRSSPILRASTSFAGSSRGHSRAEAKASGRRAVCRRRFWLQDLRLSGARAGATRRSGNRPPGAMGGDAQRAFLSDTQGRGFTTEAKLALDKDLQFLALSVEPTVDIGAYFSKITPVSATAVERRFKAAPTVPRRSRSTFAGFPPTRFPWTPIVARGGRRRPTHSRG